MKKRFRYSLRFMLVATLLVAVAAAIHLKRYPIYQSIHALRMRQAIVAFHPSPLRRLHVWTGHYFDRVQTVDMTGLKATDEDLRVIAQLQSLENLYVPRGAITLDGVKRLPAIHGLKRLALWGNYGVQDDAVNALLNCHSLAVLDVHETNIQGDQLGGLAKIPNLERLVFQAKSGGHYLDGETIDQLVAIPNLVPVGKVYVHRLNDAQLTQFLSMDTSRVVELMLIGCVLSDNGWRNLNQITLRELDIHFTEINDRQLGLLNAENFGEIQFNFGKNWDKEEVSINALSEFLDGRFNQASLFDNEINLRQIENLKRGAKERLVGKLRTKTKPLTPQQIRRWKVQGVIQIQMRRADHQREHLQAIREAKTGIHIKQPRW